MDARVYLALGGNIGDRLANLRQAVSLLGGVIQIDRLSPVYETSPMYVTDQPAFLNMAASGSTDLSPLDLLQALKQIEADLGRDFHGLRFGPRPIDLDILLYGDQIIDLPTLQVPHIRMPERAFALAPLADIAADMVHPVSGLTIGQMLAAVDGQDSITRTRDRLDD